MFQWFHWKFKIVGNSLKIKFANNLNEQNKIKIQQEEFNVVYFEDLVVSSMIFSKCDLNYVKTLYFINYKCDVP